uniref:No apical meristem-associated C-terminal domain-containing protein n=1 Tax=Tanacetum cinerariifolium TaxID=118510 RepID=A0A6L2LM05_TANCI|nr:hypothetical protein [Tanacetum cinerariifolium]
MSQPPNEPGCFTHLLKLQPTTILIFSEPIESVYLRFTKLKFFLATVSSFWNANVTRTSLSITIGVSSLRLSKFCESKKYSTTIVSTTTFSQQPSQTQFKVPQGKDLRDKRRKKNNSLSIWTRTIMMTCQDEEILPVGIETKKCCLPRLGSSTRKQRASKKQQSVDTSSAGGSTKGSQSESVSSLVSQDYRRKCDAAETTYEAKRDKELAMMQYRELEFLMLDHSMLPPEKRAIIEKKQAEIMKKHPNA